MSNVSYTSLLLVFFVCFCSLFCLVFIVFFLVGDGGGGGGKGEVAFVSLFIYKY